jgi:hypothetical protein
MVSASAERRSMKSPMQIGRVTKSKMVAVDAIASDETFKFKDVETP